MSQCGISVTVARSTTSGLEWFDSTLPLKIYKDFPHDKAMSLRKKWIKGFIKPGACNYYMAVGSGNNIFGILGFAIPDYVKYDLLIKADTTPPNYLYSVDLLLYALRTKQAKEALEEKFNREINNCYTIVFTEHQDVSRYRKHGTKITKKEIIDEGKTIGYNIGYLFELGTIPTLKSAKKMWMQKHGI